MNFTTKPVLPENVMTRISEAIIYKLYKFPSPKEVY